MNEHGPMDAPRGSDPTTTLKFRIASYEKMKSRTIRIARGELRVSPSEPRAWFASTESFALSAGDRDLLRVIAEKALALVVRTGVVDRAVESEPIAVKAIGFWHCIMRLKFITIPFRKCDK
jgi:predicted transcriptional regulator